MLTKHYINLALLAAALESTDKEFTKWALRPGAACTRCPVIVTKGTIEYDAVLAVYALQRAWASYNTRTAQMENKVARKLAYKCIMFGVL